jgi:hypothetical protein
MREFFGNRRERKMRRWGKRRPGDGEVMKAELGPAVVPNGRDYGAASMRKVE